jgi:hypothetical protein
MNGGPVSLELGSQREDPSVVGDFELVRDLSSVNDAEGLVEAVGEGSVCFCGEVATAFFTAASEDVAGALAQGEQSR